MDRQSNEQVETIEIQMLLEAVYRHCGHDFRNYSMSSLRRRIHHRMRLSHIPTVSRLMENILYDSSMLEQLIEDFSIHVTEMYRDPGFFLAFRRLVIPILRKFSHLRIWHAGCSSGEEVFSMAILLQEEGLLARTRIYATDMSEKVIEKGKKGIFRLDKMKAFTRGYHLSGGTRAFSEYYEVKEDIVQFSSHLLDRIVFAQHNLATDKSFNEFHVIICRNVMIYFDKQLQARVHQLFYESLCYGGILGLGNKESISFTSYEDHYEQIERNERIYRKKHAEVLSK